MADQHLPGELRELLEEVFVTRELLEYELAQLRRQQMASQADIDALTQQVGQVASDLAAAQTKLQAELDQLAAANPQLDLSALQSGVAALDPSVQQLANLQPDQPSGGPPAQA